MLTFVIRRLTKFRKESGGLDILAGVMGGVAGFIGCLPYILFGGKIHERFTVDGLKAFKLILLLPVLSFILMFGAIFGFGQLFKEQLLIFGITCGVVFLTGITVFAVVLVRSFEK